MSNIVEMYKLIELLNEYETDKRNETTLRGYTGGMFYYIQSCKDYLDLKIISKEYGFIKRLVDNDKIDFIKVIQKKGHWEIDNIMLSMKEREYLELLMLLSIQDNPIEFLISILK